MDNNSWAIETLKEVPFWRDGMSPEEYEEERKHFIEHWEDYKDGKYLPLWAQNNIAPHNIGETITIGKINFKDKSALQ